MQHVFSLECLRLSTHVPFGPRGAAVLCSVDRTASRHAHSLDLVRKMAAQCRNCPLWRRATQTVFGEGSGESGLMLIGEQLSSFSISRPRKNDSREARAHRLNALN
jgi:hypothetical protein